MTGALELRSVGEEADPALRALVASAFPNNPKARAEITAWQWWKNPFGPTLAWVWVDEADSDRIVAQYLAYCVPGVLDGRPCTLSLGVDAAVAPDHRGLGLFTPLSRALYHDANDHDTPLLAYPNDQSATGIARAGWCEVEQLRVYAFALDDAWLARRAHLPRAAVHAARSLIFSPRRGSGSVEVVHDVPDGVESLWGAVQATHRNGIARGGDWWRWRYGHHPDRPYRFVVVHRGGELVAAAAVRTRGELGGSFHCLMELLAVDDGAARAVIWAIAHGALGPADGIALTAVSRSTLAARARAAGLRPVPRHLQPRPVRFGVVPHPRLVPDPRVRQWSTAWGDLDHV